MCHEAVIPATRGRRRHLQQSPGQPRLVGVDASFEGLCVRLHVVQKFQMRMAAS